MQGKTPEAILRAVAPCGLHCGACVAFAGGRARQGAALLAEALGENFAPYAERFAAMQPAYADYPAFRRLLEHIASGSCTGCRGSGCLFQACRVPDCAKDHNVDFCFQCAAFPCGEHGFGPELARRWQKNNERMRAIGVEAYHDFIKDKPRYP
jgi:hypothetical protein